MHRYYETYGQGPGRGRHRRHGFGPGGHPFLGEFGGPGRGPRGRGRKARRGDIRTAALLLLAEEPRNGYQIMQEVQERSDGAWSPSPGSVYPALSQLEDEGFVRSVEADSGRAYEITDAGRQHLADRDDDTPPWEAGDSPRAQAFHDLRGKLFAIGKASVQVVQVGDESQWAKAASVLDEARRSLYRILADEPTSSDAGEATEPAGDDA